MDEQTCRNARKNVAIAPQRASRIDNFMLGLSLQSSHACRAWRVSAVSGCIHALAVKTAPVIEPSESLDAKDRLLLAYLRRNARMTTVELSGKLGLSRSSVHARISRLERAGVIRGYTVVLAEESLPDRLRCWLVIRLEKGARSETLLERLRSVNGVGAVYLLTGDVDALVEVVASSTLGIDTTRLEIASLDGIAEVRTHVVLRAAWPAGAPRDLAS